MAYEYGGESIAAIGTSKSALEFVKYNSTTKSNEFISLKPLDGMVDNRYTSLQKLLVSKDSNNKPWLYVGYDYHSLDSFNPEFYLRDNRFSNVDPNAHGEVAKFALGPNGTYLAYSKAPLSASITGGQQYGFSVGDLAVGAVNSEADDIVAINTLNNTRLGLATELDDGKLLHISPFDPQQANSSLDDNFQPPTIIVQGIDYFTPGYKIAVLDDGIVAATVPGKNYIARFQKNPLDPLRFGWQELAPLSTPGDISALDTITIDGKKQLVYVSGNNLYRKDPNTATPTQNLGLVGDSQAIAVGDIDMDGISDIAVADYNQNLQIFILDALGNVKDSQTSKINTKPRDINIFDWNRDGYNDILIADGGSGLDIKLNQLKPADPTTPTTSLLHTKFDYTYVENTDRIATKTQTDIVVQGNGIATPDLVRKTISTFDNLTGNLTNIKVIGTDNSTTAQTNTHYNDNGTIDWIKDANNNWTQYNYFGSSFGGASQQVESIVRGYGTPDATSEHYTYYETGFVKDVKDGNDRITHYDYDQMNRQTTVTKMVTVVDPISSNPTSTQNITKTDYYQTGWVKSVTDANEHTTSFEYDGVGRIAKQTAADGGKTEYTYNDIRELEYVTRKSNNDTEINKTKYEYDNAQRIVAVKDVTSGTNLATTTTYTYSPYGTNPTPEITTTVTGGGQTRITTDKYDRYQRLIESKNFIGTTVSNEYFDDGTIV